MKEKKNAEGIKVNYVEVPEGMKKKYEEKNYTE